MSGVIGIATLDGSTPDRELAGRLTSAMSYRGGDGGGVWCGPGAALGLAHARLGLEASPRPGPATLDGTTWVSAFVRLDGRAGLVERLEREGRRDLHGAGDPELILHAYAAWGTGCLEHLLGDYAFALWDAPRRTLLCGRDRFGIRPFYYAGGAGRLYVANTLEALRLCPGVSSRPNDSAVADFLLFGWNRDPSATFFQDMHTLPPAHMLVARGGAWEVRRYWNVPAEEQLHYRRPEDYLEHFEQVLGGAVEDRIRGRPTSLFMSGGRDSTAVAAVARRRMGPGFPLQAHTAVYDRLLPDEERRYSSLAASALGIPIEHHAVDDYPLFGGWSDPEVRRPEPTESFLAAIDLDILRRMARHGPVALTGFAADAGFYAPHSRLVHLALAGQVGTALREAAEYLRIHRRLPRPGVRTWWRKRTGTAGWTPPFPDWIDPELVERLSLRERWERSLEAAPARHPRRPEAYERVESPFWARIFESFDPGVSRVPVEVAHPFMDVRVVQFLLSVPLAQWTHDKALLRMTLARVLPAEFLRRQKTPLAGDPVLVRLRTGGLAPDALTLDPRLRRWVDPARLPAYAGGGGGGAPLEEGWLHLRVVALSCWVRQLGGA